MNGNIYVAIMLDAKVPVEDFDDAQRDTDIYLLPSTTTDINSPTVPVRTSNAHKIIENGQMYIILDSVKYAVTGSSTM